VIVEQVVIGSQKIQCFIYITAISERVWNKAYRGGQFPGCCRFLCTVVWSM